MPYGYCNLEVQRDHCLSTSMSLDSEDYFLLPYKMRKQEMFSLLRRNLLLLFFILSQRVKLPLSTLQLQRNLRPIFFFVMLLLN